MAGVAIAAIGGFLGETVAWGVAASFAISTTTFSLIAGAISLGVSALARSVLGGQGPDEPKAQDRQQMIRSPIANRTTVYGRAKVSGPVVFAASTGKKNKYLHLVIAIAGHEIDAVEEIWFGDKRVDLDPSGYAISAPYGKVDDNVLAADGDDELIYLSGPTLEAVFTEVAAGDHTVAITPPDGRAFDHVATVIGREITSAGMIEHPLSWSVSGSDVTYTVPVGTALNDVLIVYNTTGKVITPYARVKWHLGADDQAADADLLAECADAGWTADHRLRGIAYLYVRLQWDPKVYYSGIPNVSAVIRGKKIYDPRTGLTAWSNNWALVLADYLRSPLGLNCAESEIDAADLLASANVSDTTISLAAGPVARYQINGVIDSGQRRIDVLKSMLTAGAGDLVWSRGVYRILAGQDVAPAGALTTDDFRGPVRVQARTSRTDLANGVKVVFVQGANGRYQDAEVKPVSVPLYVAQDGGEEIYADLRLPFTTTWGLARHLGIVMLKRGRQGIVVEAPLKLSGFRYTVGDVVNLTVAQLGWVDKPFRVTRWRLADNGLGVDVTLQEFSGADYEFDPDLSEVEDAEPDTALPDPWLISPPTGIVLTESLYRTVSDVIKTRVEVAWTAPDDAVASEYQVRWWRAGEIDRTVVTTPYAGVRLDDMPTATIVASVRARNAFGIWSDWSPAVAYAVQGKTTPPDKPNLFNVEITANGSRRFNFGLSDAPIDLAGFEIRYNLGAAALDWDSQTPMHTKLLRSSPYETMGFLSGEYTFTVKAVDTTGNRSGGRSVTAEFVPPSTSVILASETARSTAWLG